MAVKKTKNSHWVVSANDLLLGDVVYLTQHNEWTRLLQSALVTSNEQSSQAMLENARSHSARVVGAEVVPVAQLLTGRLELKTLRDQLRESGPSHRDDLRRTTEQGAQHV